MSSDTPESGAESFGQTLARHRKWILLSVVLAVGWWIYRSMGDGHGGDPDGRWNGFVYPEGVSAPEGTWINGGPFQSLEQCRAWVRHELQRQYPQGVPSHADHECGLNCKPRPSGLNVCEETRR